jgi:NAD(P)-dependent dehydrogenase (short-subunit alcohol dehydrogenase family)
VRPTGVKRRHDSQRRDLQGFPSGSGLPGRDDAEAELTALNALPVPWIGPVDMSNAVLFPASDEARYITGSALLIDAGQAAKA